MGQAFGLQIPLNADFVSSHSLEFVKKAAGKQKQAKRMMQQLHGSYVQPLLREPHTFPPGFDVGLPKSGSGVLSHY